MGALAPDLVVVGEVPLAGPLYDCTLAAVELEIPLVLLDNTYSPELVRTFCRDYGPMADGIILAGPTSFHHRPQAGGSRPEEDWPYLLQVPPYIDLPSKPDGDSPEAAETVVTVLAYDEKTESLGLSLLAALAAEGLPGLRGLVLSRQPDGCRERLEALPDDLASRTEVLSPPPDPRLFEIFRRSALVVSKYGFMQTSECLALGTPVIATFHEGFTWLDHMPEAARRFTYSTSAGEATTEVRAAARRLLAATPDDLREVHDGSLEAARRAVRFLESLPHRPRPGTSDECRSLGFGPEDVARALATRIGFERERLRRLRGMRLRTLREGAIFSLLAQTEGPEGRRWLRLWGRSYPSPAAATQDHERAQRSDSGRRVLAFDADAGRLLELDPGQALLPEHEIYV
jgi:hypothetical protein